MRIILEYDVEDGWFMISTYFYDHPPSRLKMKSICNPTSLTKSSFAKHITIITTCCDEAVEIDTASFVSPSTCPIQVALWNLAGL